MCIYVCVYQSRARVLLARNAQVPYKFTICICIFRDIYIAILYIYICVCVYMCVCVCVSKPCSSSFASQCPGALYVYDMYMHI